MSLYLSRLILDLRSRQVMSEIAHPYEMHRTLMRAFPKASDDSKLEAREELGVLFRADVEERRGVVKVYVQSLIEPDWSFLNRLDGYLYEDVDGPNPSCKNILSAYQKIQNGQTLAFRLRANPTKRNAREGDPLKGKRVELQREEEQIQWLMDKGQGGRNGVPGGFELLTKKIENGQGEDLLIPRVNVRCEGKQKTYKGGQANGHTMTHLSVLFEGALRVTDAKAFLETLVRGVGSGKAFGFGLLSVAPLRK